jgi:hypothetical protein
LFKPDTAHRDHTREFDSVSVSPAVLGVSRNQLYEP